MAEADRPNASRPTIPPPLETEQSDEEDNVRPHLICIAGGEVGRAYPLESDATIGRSAECTISTQDGGTSRLHARVNVEDGKYTIEDLGSVNGTRINGVRLSRPHHLRDGDRIKLGASLVFRFAMLSRTDELYQKLFESAVNRESGTSNRLRTLLDWSPDSWRQRTQSQNIDYDDEDELERVVARLRRLPPLVTSWEIEELKQQIAEAQEGRRFLLQGGDCAEMLDECDPSFITSKLKILIQMSLVLVRGARRPIIRVGRFAGQYAKPRSRSTEVRGDVELPSYFGDIVNRAEFTADARRPDPKLLLSAYYHAALTLNFVRALSSGGFSDLRRPEYFDLFFDHAELPSDLRHDYKRLCREVSDGMHFMRAVGDRADSDLMKIKFYASHEGLNLHYESAQTRRVPRREGFYDLTTHLPWVGERTRSLSGAHIDFFRGIGNPVAVKIGPNAQPEEIVELCRTLNPANEPGKLILITRLGVKAVTDKLPPVVEAVRRARRLVLWVSDPMHGNALVTRSGIKTRDFEHILKEVELTMDVHTELKTYLGGVHFELTGEDVTECIGGGLGEEDLTQNYATLCDPRLNYRQAIQMAFCLARRMDDGRPPSTMPPPMSGAF